MKRLLWLRLVLCVLLVPQLALGAQLPLVVQWMATAPLQLTWAQSTASEAHLEPLPIFPHAPAVQSTRTRQGALPLCLTCGEPVQLAQAEAPLQLTWTQSTASEASPEPLPNFPHAPAVRSTRTRQGEAQLAQAELDKDELPGLLVLVAEQAGGWGLTKHTGLYDFGARQYDARQGQWLSPDPAFDGLNLYAYVHNNPINLIDPFGLSAETGTFTEHYNDAPPLVDTQDAAGNQEVVFDADTLRGPGEDVIRYNNRARAAGKQQEIGSTGFRKDFFDTKITDTSDTYRKAIEAVHTVAPTGGVFGALGKMFLWAKRGAKISKVAGGIGGAGLKFTQTTASPVFRHGPFAGRTIGEVAEGLRSGAINPAQLPIDVIVRNGETLALNTRSLLALRRGGVDPSNFVINNRTGNTFFESMLTQRLGNNGLTGGVDTLRISGLGQGASSLR